MPPVDIHAPRELGAGPHRPFVYRLPTTGPRSIRLAVTGLPGGLSLDPATGIISGTTPEAGRYPLALRAESPDGGARARIDLVVGDRIALTPPLGWNSWNCFGDTVDEGHVRAAAHALVTSGLADVGWSYVNIDDGWQGARDRHGRLHPNDKFGDLAALAADVHAHGLRIGIYSSPGPTTCAGFVGSAGHEADDARAWAEWGFDYLKYDWCSYAPAGADLGRAERIAPYRRMRDALDATGRDIVYSICQYGEGSVSEWGAEAGGNSWRTTGDITDTWDSVATIGFGQDGLERHAGPGRWNDPDMLVVGDLGWGAGLRPSRLTAQEQRTHLTLWSLLAAPLLLGCDLTRIDAVTLALLTNTEMLAINQDHLGLQGRRAWTDGAVEAWTKPLADDALAIGVFNRGDRSRAIELDWQRLGLPPAPTVRDVWNTADLPATTSGVPLALAPHGSALLRVDREWVATPDALPHSGA